MAGTGIEKDIATFKAALDTAIEGAMTNEVLDEVKDALQLAIDSEVYGTYQPTKYQRRGEDMMRGTGALTDPDVMVHSYDVGTHTLTVTDMAKGGDPTRPERAEKLLAPIIESGEGYTWGLSRIAREHRPRPFHDVAERMIAVGDRVMSFEFRLIEGLKNRNFDSFE